MANVAVNRPPPSHPQQQQQQQQQQQANVHYQNGVQHSAPPQSASIQKLATVNEDVWIQLGKTAELMGDTERALASYENALRHNAYSIPAMTQIASVLRSKEQFQNAIEFLQRIIAIEQNNGEVWSHCYLMMDDLQKAYGAYQQALYHLQNPKEPKLWYGIGILYDRYGSYDHAEEAFSQVLRMEPNFEKGNEIYFRLGIIYKQQRKFQQALEVCIIVSNLDNDQCFKYILNDPPRPLTEVDVYFQIGHVFESQKEFKSAKEAYERVLTENPNHAKVLQQLGWLHHQPGTTFTNQELGVSYLTKSLEVDGNDAQSWYLLGRCYMAQQKYNKAYEAYQQAVYRDGHNPTFWCSIGVLYYQINQYRDALDAYSRAIRLNPYISEVWYDLGTLYESCNNQVQDAIDAYTRASELDPQNHHIKSRLNYLRSGGQAGAHANNAPHPQDVNPTAYQPAIAGPPTHWTQPSVETSRPNGTDRPSDRGPMPAHLPHQPPSKYRQEPPLRHMTSPELSKQPVPSLANGPPPMNGLRQQMPTPIRRSPPPVQQGPPVQHYSQQLPREQLPPQLRVGYPQSHHSQQQPGPVSALSYPPNSQNQPQPQNMQSQSNRPAPPGGSLAPILGRGNSPNHERVHMDNGPLISPRGTRYTSDLRDPLASENGQSGIKRRRDEDEPPRPKMNSSIMDRPRELPPYPHEPQRRTSINRWPREEEIRQEDPDDEIEPPSRNIEVDEDYDDEDGEGEGDP
ncbi:General transcriptional corepressor ssn6 [Neolecta irregularis DAH-3]|uniref:General transcriptional corepressor ssn6 n=1 Tax=Neolecta irregularis (strain DAH-3) TaxID=1198029 RepID=A0A1U7LGC3_NEOID|nr:General transcriptional corepressor ssn6 [Neolecta irregularis DAH-3]|eukprot:OLL21705.1 General transcriptional corepressor ssn6 [Neolecta irregularis DAH-3]